MATRKELNVGQERELILINDNVRPRVKILALDQPMEVYSEYGFKLKEDRVLIEVVDPHGWFGTRWSRQIETKRPSVQRVGGQLMGAKNPAPHFRTRRWEEEDLPKGQYLVTTRTLGPIWDQAAKEEERILREDHDRREGLYKAAVEEQHRLIDKELELAGVPTTRWHGREYHLTFNDMARLINQLQQTDYLPQVHHQDFFDGQVQ